MKTFIIGDIHGCRDALARLLDKVAPFPREDRVILLGDLFDRGPDSYGVWKEVLSLSDFFEDRFFLLRGNHEDYLMAEKLTFSQKLMWNRVGRKATVKSFAEHDKKVEETLPWLREHTILFYRDEEIQCAHAGVLSEPIESNDLHTLVHDHGVALSNRYAGRLTVTGHIALGIPTWFAGDGETREKIYWGEDNPLPSRGVLCIDTGCGKGGRLTAMILKGDTYRLESTGTL